MKGIGGDEVDPAIGYVRFGLDKQNQIWKSIPLPGSFPLTVTLAGIVGNMRYGSPLIQFLLRTVTVGRNGPSRIDES